jgi:hypothetical protein
MVHGAGSWRIATPAIACCWGAAMDQPTWVSPCGRWVGADPRRDADMGRGAGCGHGAWDGMRAEKLCLDATSDPNFCTLALPIN